MQFGTVLPDDGGAEITNIQLWMDDGLGGDFYALLGLQTPSLRTQLTLTSEDHEITAGRYYRFKYRCQNQNGFSEYSEITYILAA